MALGERESCVNCRAIWINPEPWATFGAADPEICIETAHSDLSFFDTIGLITDAGSKVQRRAKFWRIFLLWTRFRRRFCEILRGDVDMVMCARQLLGRARLRHVWLVRRARPWPGHHRVV